MKMMKAIRMYAPKAGKALIGETAEKAILVQ